MAKQPFVPVQGVIRVRFVGTHQTAPWVNGFCIQYSGSPPQAAAMQTLATQLRTIWGTAYSTMLTTLTNLRVTQVWDISSDQGASGVDNTVVAGTGASTNPLPVQSAVVVTWPVQQRWRGGHFRTYMVGRTVTDITNGRTLVSAASSVYQASSDTFRSQINTFTFNGGAITLGGVRYFPTGHNADGTPITKTRGEFKAFGIPIVHTRLDSQRRRSGKELA